MIVAVAITAANLALVWGFRFLPLFDYPMWLYEVDVLRNLHTQPFSRFYELASTAVPNTAMTAILYALSFIMPLEAAGKIFLSLCVAGLPWGFRFAALQFGGAKESPVSFLAFPFAFGPYFFAGQAFCFGLVLLFLFLGYVARANRSSRFWYLLACAFVVFFLVHGIVFMLAAVVLGFLERKQHARRVGLAAIPALLLLAWYISGSGGEANAISLTVWLLLQNSIKPFLVFVKSYGITPLIPLTLLNGGWILLLAAFTFLALKKSWGMRAEPAMGLRITGLVIIAAAVCLPDNLLNIVQPGGRLMLPGFLLLSLSASSPLVKRTWSWVLLAVAATSTLYNVTHFARVDEQMNELYADIRSVERGSVRFASVRLDWPPSREWQNALAPSIDPLFGAAYYAFIGSNTPAPIFGTALLRVMNPDAFPVFRGTTPELLADDLLRVYGTSTPYDLLVVAGNHASREKVAAQLSGFSVRIRKPDWLVLSKSDAH